MDLVAQSIISSLSITLLIIEDVVVSACCVVRVDSLPTQKSLVSVSFDEEMSLAEEAEVGSAGVGFVVEMAADSEVSIFIRVSEAEDEDDDDEDEEKNEDDGGGVREDGEAEDTILLSLSRVVGLFSKHDELVDIDTDEADEDEPGGESIISSY